MNQQSEHLSNAQIENYGDRTSGTGPDKDQRDEDQRTDAHLADCASCRSRLLDFQRAHFALLADPKRTDSKLADAMQVDPKRLGDRNQLAERQVNTASTPECPSEDSLRQLAAGLCSDDIAATLTYHAATCDHCGLLLKAYTEDFSDDFTVEEQTALASLQSSAAKWQNETARKMLAGAETSASSATATAAPVADVNSSGASATVDKKSSATLGRKPFSWKWTFVPSTAATVAATAVICGVVGFGILYARRDTPEKVEKLLAKAYTGQRTMEMRWPEAEWAAPHVTLGPSETRFSKPRELFDAEKIIQDHPAAPDDMQWLRLKAQAELLEDQSGPAIELLKPAMRTEPIPVPVLLDLAMAYSQQSKKSHDPKDNLTVIDLLTRVLKKEPQNRTAIFNLAIAYANNEMWDQSVATWNAYLRLDSEGPWAQEAKDKLATAKARLHSSMQYPSSPPDEAASFLTLPEGDAAFQSEQYQEIALRSWLTKAVADPQSPEYMAITRLGRVSARISSDTWLNDFLRDVGRDPSGAEALSAAVAANRKGHYAEAIDQAQRAARIFKLQRNRAGELRARYESVYAQQRFLRGANCLARADPLQARIGPTSYFWLQSQLGMEIAVCLNFVSRLSEIDVPLSLSLQIAEKSHLPLSVLRNLGFSQSLNQQRGRYDVALNEGVKGLHAYWAGPPSTARIYQFYAGFALCAEKMGLWAAAEALMLHAVDLLRAENDDIQRGAALLELSKVFVAEKDDAAAETATLDANRLFDREITEPTSRSYRLNGKIGLAELQLRRGSALEALATIEPARELLSETDGYFVSLNFYRLSGNVNLALRRLDRASSAYKEAILIAERALAGLTMDAQRLKWIATAEDAYRGLVRVYIEQHDPENAWKLWEWYVSRSEPENLTDAAREESANRGWPDLWQAVSSVGGRPSEPERIVYAVFDDGVQVWMSIKGRLKARWVPIARERLEQMVQQFSQACARKDSPLSEVQKLGQELFTLLVQPVSEELPPASLLVVELDRPLSGLPVEAMRSPSGWYFGEKFPIVYSPGVMYEKRLRNKLNLSSNQPFLLLDASTDGYLPGGELERSTILRIFTKATTIGPEADSAGIAARLSQSAIFGFIGHGEPYATGTGLRVNPNLLLKAEDFSPRNLHRLQLAVLAACSTASSGADGLLDNRSLVHAFLSSGVPSVIASGWNVDSQATAEFMTAFYSHFAKNQSVELVMFAARNETIGRYPHPYYWSAFTLTGKTK